MKTNKYLKLLFFLIFVVFLGAMIIKEEQKKEVKSSSLTKEEILVKEDIIFFYNEYVLATSQPVFIEEEIEEEIEKEILEESFSILGVKIESTNEEKKKLLHEIIRCESNWKNVCNAQYGCNAGQGIAQLIPSTAKTCSEALGRNIDPFNKQDSLDCAWYLLTETSQGYYHWGYPDGHPNAYHDGIRWGSFNCWGWVLEELNL